MRAKAKIISDMNYIGLVAVVRVANPDHVLQVCDALVKGGMSILELTMTIPSPIEAMQGIIKYFGQRAIVGMGSIRDAKTARDVLDAGAEFIVSPITKLEVAAAARAANRVVMLGAYTPTEAELAYSAGCDYVKLFPANTLGPKYVEALLAPMPHLRLVPTGGVTVDNAAEFLDAGAPLLGVGSSLITRQILDSSNWSELERRANAFVQVVRTFKDRKIAPGI